MNRDDDVTEALRAGRDALVADAARSGVEFGRALSALVDSTLQTLLERSGDESVAIVALGSYARRELCPGSDIDVVLVLLIIFMVITPMLSKGISVELVKTKNPIAMQAADKDDAILVSVTKDGKVYLGSDQFTSLTDLGVKVKDRLTAKLDKTVYLKNDSRARYERVVEVIDNLRGFGVDQLGLLTEQIKEAGAPGAAAPPAGI